MKNGDKVVHTTIRHGVGTVVLAADQQCVVKWPYGTTGTYDQAVLALAKPGDTGR